MGWTLYQFFLAGLMLFTGSINTLSTKWADVQNAVGSPRWTQINNEERAFYHPFFQSLFMFIGELACLFVFKLHVAYNRCKQRPVDVGPQRFSPFVLLPPAMCDMCGTSLMYMGLALTYASSFQMLRGAVIIFTGLLSVAFLGKKLKVYEWLGMFTVLAGLIVVGITDLLQDKGGLPINNILTGKKLKVYEWLGMFTVLAGLIVVGITDLLQDKGGLPINNILTGKKLKVYEWLGMFTVLAGLIVVGITDLLQDKGGLPINNILTGKKLKVYERLGMFTVLAGLIVVGITDLLQDKGGLPINNILTGKKLKVYEWLGMFTVLAGLIVVGITDLLQDKGGLPINNILTGDLLIILAQIITATQMVIEEKFLKQHDIPPLQVVGWEGFFGFSVLIVLLVPFYFIPAGAFTPVSLPDYPLEDSIDAFWQMDNNKIIIIATAGTLISIAFFNFAGVSVTRELNATTRMVLDSVRTLTVWLVSVAVGWENFHPLLIVGFGLLILGTFIYNDAIFAPFLRSRGLLSSSTESERERLITPVSNDMENGGTIN